MSETCAGKQWWQSSVMRINNVEKWKNTTLAISSSTCKKIGSCIKPFLLESMTSDMSQSITSLQDSEREKVDFARLLNSIKTMEVAPKAAKTNFILYSANCQVITRRQQILSFSVHFFSSSQSRLTMLMDSFLYFLSASYLRFAGVVGASALTRWVLDTAFSASSLYDMKEN